jgi:hypothetical protein
MSTVEIVDAVTNKYTFENGCYMITTLEVEDEKSYTSFGLYQSNHTPIELTPEQHRSLRDLFGGPDLRKVEAFLNTPKGWDRV